MGADVGIVVPAFRPDPGQLARYLEALKTELAPTRVHVEVDDPNEAVLEALEGTPASVNVSQERRGKGAAITAGFDALDTEILAFVDADGSTPPSSLAAVLDPVERNLADLSVGSRRHPDATVLEHQSRVRRRLGDLFVHVARQVLPIALHDYQCGAKAINQETWQSVRGNLVSPGFAWDIELITLADAVGARVIEVPIAWEDKAGTTVGTIGTTTAFLHALIRSRHRAACLQGSRFHRYLDRWIGQETPVIAGNQSRSTEWFQRQS